MEDHLPTAAETAQWSERFARTLEEQRERAQQLLQAERDRIQQIERTLAEQLRKVTHELQQDISDVERRDLDLARQADRIGGEGERTDPAAEGTRRAAAAVGRRGRRTANAAAGSPAARTAAAHAEAGRMPRGTGGPGTPTGRTAAGTRTSQSGTRAAQRRGWKPGPANSTQRLAEVDQLAHGAGRPHGRSTQLPWRPRSNNSGARSTPRPQRCTSAKPTLAAQQTRRGAAEERAPRTGGSSWPSRAGTAAGSGSAGRNPRHA